MTNHLRNYAHGEKASFCWDHFPFFLQLKVVTGQLFLPELVAFKTMLWLKGFTLGFPGSNIQSFMISVQDLEKFPPLPDPKICKWLILVWEYCPDQMLAWFPKSTKVKLITWFHDSWIYDFFSCSSQNLHWKLGQQMPSVGTLLAYLDLVRPWSQLGLLRIALNTCGTTYII